MLKSTHRCSSWCETNHYSEMERWDVVVGVYGAWNWYHEGDTVISNGNICSMTIRASGWIDVQDKIMGGENIKSLRGEVIARIFSITLKSPRNCERSTLGESDRGSGMRIFSERWEVTMKSIDWHMGKLTTSGLLAELPRKQECLGRRKGEHLELAVNTHSCKKDRFHLE